MPAGSHLQLAEHAAEGGADAVQLREKRPLAAAEIIEVACRMRERLDERDVALFINDRADLAFAVGARGVHLGRTDLPARCARELLGQRFLIGGTANSHQEALEVAAGPVDYLGVGPVYGTVSKANPAPRLGLEALARICREVDQPVIAIGGITEERVGEVLDAGAHGIAVLSAVAHDRDPAEAAARFRARLDAHAGGR
ncbi:hypothetical protein ABI59_03705 [Acidobacteria bacterium Mor1]|nr:hypothetical protein ABI59_03705 [Acidobacteria bacterium Mor1]